MAALVEAQMFEQYRINRWLGSGISGETYEAEDTVQLRKVALKLIHPWEYCRTLRAASSFARCRMSASFITRTWLPSWIMANLRVSFTWCGASPPPARC